jgi:hypothetical protein
MYPYTTTNRSHQPSTINKPEIVEIRMCQSLDKAHSDTT